MVGLMSPCSDLLDPFQEAGSQVPIFTPLTVPKYPPKSPTLKYFMAQYPYIYASQTR